MTRSSYFAYGSNLDAEVMKIRCPEAAGVSPACLADWRIVPRGFADMSFREKTGVDPLPISAAAYDNIDALVKKLFSILNTLPAPEPLAFEPFEYTRSDPDEFEINKLSADTYEVTGGLVEMLIRKVVLSDHESNRYFQNVLKEKGVIAKLRERGAKDGDTIIVGDVEFELWD